MFTRLAEQRIQAAMEAAEFDNLASHGRPIDLERYFATPQELRAAYAVLKNAGVLPEEASLLKEIHDLEARLQHCTDEGARAALTRDLGARKLKHGILVDRSRTKRR